VNLPGHAVLLDGREVCGNGGLLQRVLRVVLVPASLLRGRHIVVGGSRRGLAAGRVLRAGRGGGAAGVRIEHVAHLLVLLHRAEQPLAPGTLSPGRLGGWARVDGHRMFVDEGLRQLGQIAT